MESVSQRVAAQRVVGSPVSGRLFGAKSIEALTASEARRSGAWSPPARPWAQDVWDEQLTMPSEDARRQCGLPALSPTLQEPEVAWAASQSDASSEEVAAPCEPDSTPRKSLWRRILEAFRCLRGR